MTAVEGGGHRVLVVDDEPDITALVAYHLAKDGYRVSTATNGRDALRAAREERPDLIVLDLMLPGVSGYDILAELRRQDETREVGVIVLTARKEGRLAARPVASGGLLSAGPITLDRTAHRASVHGKEVELTATEFRLLRTLIERQGRVQSRAQLLETVWQAQPDIQTRTVDMHVQRLRHKLGRAGDAIETVRGAGYRLRAATPPTTRKRS